MYAYVDVCVYVGVYIYMHVYMYFFFFFFLTTNLTDSFPPLSLESADTRRNIWCSQENAKSHESRRSNPWSYTPIEMHIRTTIK